MIQASLYAYTLRPALLGGQRLGSQQCFAHSRGLHLALSTLP